MGRTMGSSIAIDGGDSTADHLSHSHADVLGVKVSAVDLKLAVELAERWIASGRRAYICVTGVHGVMEAQTDTEFRGILNSAAINVPDGMPMSWVGWLQGFHKMDRVFGPDLMAALCAVSVQRGYRNFLYGGKPGVAQLLSEKLQYRFHGLQVAGTYTPPFGPITLEQERRVCEMVHESKPHIMWVGLSTPKQERFMAQYINRLQVPLLIGVGAAFDYHTGQIRDCSAWIKRAGLQWAHRLMQDPRRLGRRYLRNNPLFLWKIAGQFLGVHSGSCATEDLMGINVPPE